LKNISKLILPILILIVIGLIYYSYFKPSDELGDFGKFSVGNEISQEINVAIVKSKTIQKDENGRIISFVAKDKNNVEVIVKLREPASESILDAKVILLLGHLHKNGFVASSSTIIK